VGRNTKVRRLGADYPEVGAIPPPLRPAYRLGLVWAACRHLPRTLARIPMW
jgi:hypothetical protein